MRKSRSATDYILSYTRLPSLLRNLDGYEYDDRSVRHLREFAYIRSRNSKRQPLPIARLHWNSTSCLIFLLTFLIFYVLYSTFSSPSQLLQLQLHLSIPFPSTSFLPSPPHLPFIHPTLPLTHTNTVIVPHLKNATPRPLHQTTHHPRVDDIRPTGLRTQRRPHHLPARIHQMPRIPAIPGLQRTRHRARLHRRGSGILHPVRRLRFTGLHARDEMLPHGAGGPFTRETPRLAREESRGAGDQVCGYFLFACARSKC